MLQHLVLNLLAILGIVIFWQISQSLGTYVLSRLSISLPRVLDRILISSALGWIIIGYVLYGLGLAGWLYVSVLVILLVVLVLIACYQQPWQEIRKLNFSIWYRQSSFIAKLLMGVFGLIVLLNLINALAPDIWFDSTWYHLTTAQTYLATHTARLTWPSVFDVSSVAPHLVDLIFTILLLPARTSSILPQLFSYLAGLGLAVGTYTLGRRFLTREFAMMAGLIVYGTSIISWLSQSAYIDLFPAFFGLTALLAILVWSEERGQVKFALISAILMAGMLGSKMQALVFVPILFFIFVWSQFRVSGSVAKFSQRIVPSLFWTAGLTFLFTLPWYLEIWAVTGSPLFTIKQASAGSEFFAGTNSLSEWVFIGHPQTFWHVMRNLFVPSSAIYLAALLSFAFWKKMPSLGRMLVVSGWLMVIAWSYIPIHEVRYGLLMFVPLAIMVAWLGSVSLISRIICLFCMAIFLGYNALGTLELASARWPVALGLKSRDEFLRRSITNSIYTYYDSDGMVKKIVGDGTALALVHNAFYLDVAWIDAVRFKATTYGALTMLDDVIVIWKQAGVTHLVIHGPWRLDSFVDQHDFPGGETNLPAGERVKLSDHVRLLYQNGFTQVWELL